MVQLRSHAGIHGLQGSELSPQLQELGLELSQSGTALLGRSSISFLSGHFITLVSSLTASDGRNLDKTVVADLVVNSGLCSLWMESESSGSANLFVETQVIWFEYVVNAQQCSYFSSWQWESWLDGCVAIAQRMRVTI